MGGKNFDRVAFPESIILLLLFKDLLPVLSSHHLSFKTRGHVYSSCVRAQCSMPARLGHWQSQTSSVCREMTGQWSDRSAMSDHKTLSPPGPMSYLCSLALRIWTSFWKREDSDSMDMWNAPMVQSRQPLTYRLMESVGLGGPRWHGNSWQRGIAESGSSRPSTLMIDIPGDLVWDLPCMQQASYLEGGPLVWMLPLYLHVNQKSDYDMISSWSGCRLSMRKYWPHTICLSEVSLLYFQRWWLSPS